MTKIHLYGGLAKKYGKTFLLDVETPLMAARGLIFTLGEKFKKEFKDTRFNVVIGALRKGNGIQSEKDITVKTNGKDIHFVPVIKGSGKYGMAIVGVVLIIAGAYFGQPWMVQLGVGMVAGGIAQALAAQPQTNNVSAAAKNESYMFNGPVNTVTQGGPVPLVFGRCLVGSTVISAGTTTEKLEESVVNNFEPFVSTK